MFVSCIVLTLSMGAPVYLKGFLVNDSQLIYESLELKGTVTSSWGSNITVDFGADMIKHKIDLKLNSTEQQIRSNSCLIVKE